VGPGIDLVRTRTLLLAGVIAVGAAATVLAQGEPPTVGVTSNGKAVTLSGAEGLAPGPVRFELRGSGRRPRTFTILRLKPGVTQAEALAALPRIARRGDFRPLRRYVVLEAGGDASSTKPYVTTVDLEPGSYLAGDTTGMNARKYVFEPFTVGGEPSTAVKPAPDATVGMVDYGYQVKGTLPRSGTLRFENRGRQFHFTLSGPLRRGASAREVKRLLRDPDFNPAKLPVPDLDQPVGLVSPGTANDVEYRFPRAGRYLFVCFYGDSGSRGQPHSRLGMSRIVRVR